MYNEKYCLHTAFISMEKKAYFEFFCCNFRPSLISQKKYGIFSTKNVFPCFSISIGLSFKKIDVFGKNMINMETIFFLSFKSGLVVIIML